MVAADQAGISGLRAALSGRVVARGDEDWDVARQAFNLAVDQRPAAVAFPADADEVAATVRFAAQRGLQVAPQLTGHNAAPLGPLDGALLLRTDGLDDAAIDTDGTCARVGAGVRWGDVVRQASPRARAALHGSSPGVGVVGYSLGGGLGWYARRWGLAANSVTAVELVAADGSRLRTDSDHEPELFWALRGGGGNFGVVTAMEFALYPVGELYAGALFFPWERSAEVLHAWYGLLGHLPDTITSCGRIMQFPPFPDVPESLRGRSFVVIEAACLGGAEVAAPLLAPLRRLRPSLDTFAAVAPEQLLELHMDPPLPVPALSGHLLLEDLPPSAIDDLVAVAGPGSGSPLVAVDLRHTGAALARSQPHDGAVGVLPGVLSLFAVGVPADPAAGAAVGGQLAQVTAVLADHAVGQSLNMVEGPVAARQVYPPATYRRLQRVRGQYDPEQRFRANHPVPLRG